MHRRDFIKFMSFMGLALKSGAITKAAYAGVTAPPGAGLKGSLVAACMAPKEKCAFAKEMYVTSLSRLDLETGLVSLVPIDMPAPHDVLKVKDKYLVIPNGGDPNLYVSDFSGGSETLTISGDRYISGHAFFDKKENIVLVSVANREKKYKGEFAIYDADDYKLLGIQEIGTYSPHDIQPYDENTLAVCNYGRIQKDSPTGWTSGPLLNDESTLTLIDRKTLKLKETIPAYKGAMISHITIASNGDLYAIGFNEFGDKNVGNWTGEYIKDKFSSFYEEKHKELLPLWPEIAENLKISRVETLIRGFGIPLLPIKLSKDSDAFETLSFDHFHHRRAQSICYVNQTDTICMSFPFSNSLLLYNPVSGTSRSIPGEDLNLEEIRGITQIEGTSLLAVAGIRRGISIIDTAANDRQVRYYDIEMGRIVHMHHIV